MKQKNRFRGWLLPKRKETDTIPVIPFETHQPLRKIWKEYRWTIIIVLIVLIILFANIVSYAQGVKPGDRLPDLRFAPLTGYEHPSASLSDFRGKIVILDFWATWCAPCVMMIPKMDSLQREFAGKVQFIAIAYQPENVVNNFMEKLEAQRHQQYHLTKLCGDTTLKNIFRPASYPHYVWIDAEGNMAAITGFQDITADNIQKLLKGEALATTVKQYAEVPYDYHKPMLIGGNGGDGSNLLYHSFLTSYTPGLPPGRAIVVDSLKGKKITCKNNCIHWLYETAFSDSGRSFNRQNTRYLVKDTTRITNRKAVGQAYLDWLAEGNGYCYELQVPPALVPAALSMMRQDLDRYFTQYKAAIIKEDRQCLILGKSSPSKIPVNAGAAPDVRLDRFGWTVSNCTIDVLCQRLNFFNIFRYPVIDETGITSAVDLEIPIKQVTQAGGPDIEAINQELSRYGLQLQPGKRKQEILIIQDRQP